MNTEARERLSREQYHRIEADPRLRRDLIRADFGRSLIWEVRWNGEPVADLINPREEEENWTSYEIVPRELFSDKPAPLDSPAFWLSPSVTFANRTLNLVATHASAAGDGPNRGRIRMHGLRFSVKLTTWTKLRMQWQSMVQRFRA